MADFPSLSAETTVYRAILQKDWINKSGTSVTHKAFKRFNNDTTGVSVAFTREGAKADLTRPIAGTCAVYVGKIREIINEQIRLDVIQDRVDHANIIGLPFLLDAKDENERIYLNDLMTFFTRRLAAIATDIERETNT